MGGFNLGIKLTRTDDNFVIMAPIGGHEYKIVLSGLEMFGTKLIVSALVADLHKKLLLTRDVIMPFTRTELKPYSLPARERGVNLTRIFEGRIPKHIVIAFVDSAAFHGSRHLNPFFFQNFDVRKVQLSVSGAGVPLHPYEPDWGKGHYIREYRAFMDNVGVSRMSNHVNMVTRKMYHNGYTIFAFDLSPDKCLDFCNHSHKQGSVDLQLTFGGDEGLARGVTVLVQGSTEQVVSISHDKTALLVEDM
jgi:hypothetical protein